MGRNRKKQKAKRRINHKRKREIRIKMGKPVYFNLTHSTKSIHIPPNAYNYKANMHKLRIEKASNITNVKYQASIISYCCFNNVNLRGVDFFNTNLRGTTFKNAKLSDVVFFCCNLDGANFVGAKLDKVAFICTNLKDVKGLTDNSGYKVYNTYPKIQIDNDLVDQLLSLSANKGIFRYKVLHVNRSKINHWCLNLLFESFGDIAYQALSALAKMHNRQNFFTVYSYKKYIDNFDKM